FMLFSSTGLLQFAELRDLLAAFAGSSAGRDVVQALEPHSDREALESDLAEAGEAIEYLRAASGTEDASRGVPVRLRFDQLRDIDASVRVLLVEGARLDGREILDLFHTLALAGEYRGVLVALEQRFPLLSGR